jgi:K(+)-stimulated pyrophosphate-energized sodium pump
MNPIIKFTTLFGLLALELAIGLDRGLSLTLAVIFFAVSLFFVVRSFSDMRIRDDNEEKDAAAEVKTRSEAEANA